MLNAYALQVVTQYRSLDSTDPGSLHASPESAVSNASADLMLDRKICTPTCGQHHDPIRLHPRQLWVPLPYYGMPHQSGPIHRLNISSHR
jgi:hypothetical protein